MAGKEYDVFISYAEPDKALAKTLHDLLAELGLRSFFAREDIGKIMTSGWRKSIFKQGIKKSYCFVPIWTRESLNRTWVVFEAGAAEAIASVHCLCTKVAGITDAEIYTIPNTYDQHHHALFTIQGLKNLLFDINKKLPKEERLHSSKIDHIFVEGSENVSTLVSLASIRWAFIAGNTPEKIKSKPKNVKSSFTKKVKSFLTTLSEKMLENGFSLSACPQVGDVEKVVLKTAQKWISKKPPTYKDVDYEIAGIYPIDRDVRRSKDKIYHDPSKWQEHLIKFRKSYLENKEWLILVGGNQGTLEEYKAVVDLCNEQSVKIKTYPIPCFGGTARSIFEELSKHSTGHLTPCIKCTRKDGACKNIDAIVEKLVGKTSA